MKKILLSLFLAGATLGQAHADPMDQGTAARFVAAFYQAVQKHDIAAVGGMMDDKATVQVQWLDGGDPPPQFTLSKADFLQQLRATWHFATNDSYDVKDINVETDASGATTVSVLETENRLLFGNKAGQRNQLRIRLGGGNDNPRIAGMTSKTVFW